MLLDEDEEYMVIAAAEGINQEVIAETKQRIGDGVAGWVVEHKKPVLLQSKFSRLDMIWPPYGPKTDRMLKILNRGK